MCTNSSHPLITKPEGLISVLGSVEFCGFQKGPDTGPLLWTETCVVFHVDFHVVVVVLMGVCCKKMGAVAAREQLPLLYIHAGTIIPVSTQVGSPLHEHGL